jgi:hypothetical protein
MTKTMMLPEHWEEPYGYPPPNEECSCRREPPPFLCVGGSSTYKVEAACPEHALLYFVGIMSFEVRGE